jgi:hypothetical protein
MHPSHRLNINPEICLQNTRVFQFLFFPSYFPVNQY